MNNKLLYSLILLILGISFLSLLEQPKQRFDDVAFMKYSAHATPALNAEVTDAVSAQTTDAKVLERYAIRLKTPAFYPAFNAITRAFERRFVAFDYLSVFLAMICVNLLAVGYLFFIRRRHPSSRASSIDLAFILVALDLVMVPLGLWKFFPFNNGAYDWYNLFPRASIEILFLSQLYVYFSSASRKTKITNFIVATLLALLLNAPYALFILAVLSVALLLIRMFGKLQFPLTFLSILFAFTPIFAHFGLPLHLTIRAVIWFCYTVGLLYCTRHSKKSEVRSLFIFFASFCLAGQFFDYNVPGSVAIGLIAEMVARPMGYALFLFMFILADHFDKKTYARVLNASAVSLIVLAIVYAGRHPLTMLFAKSPSSTVPSATNETEFVLYFSKK